MVDSLERKYVFLLNTKTIFCSRTLSFSRAFLKTFRKHRPCVLLAFSVSRHHKFVHSQVVHLKFFRQVHIDVHLLFVLLRKVDDSWWTTDMQVHRSRLLVNILQSARKRPSLWQIAAFVNKFSLQLCRDVIFNHFSRLLDFLRKQLLGVFGLIKRKRLLGWNLFLAFGARIHSTEDAFAKVVDLYLDFLGHAIDIFCGLLPLIYVAQPMRIVQHLFKVVSPDSFGNLSLMSISKPFIIPTAPQLLFFLHRQLGITGPA